MIRILPDFDMQTAPITTKYIYLTAVLPISCSLQNETNNVRPPSRLYT